MEKKLIKLLSGLFTIIFLYFLISVLTSDFILSLVPGWSTTLYPFEIIILFIIALVIPIIFVVYILISNFIRLMFKLFTK